MKKRSRFRESRVTWLAVPPIQCRNYFNLNASSEKTGLTRVVRAYRGAKTPFTLTDVRYINEQTCLSVTIKRHSFRWPWNNMVTLRYDTVAMRPRAGTQFYSTCPSIHVTWWSTWRNCGLWAVISVTSSPGYLETTASASAASSVGPRSVYIIPRNDPSNSVNISELIRNVLDFPITAIFLEAKLSSETRTTTRATLSRDQDQFDAISV